MKSRGSITHSTMETRGTNSESKMRKFLKPETRLRFKDNMRVRKGGLPNQGVKVLLDHVHPYPDEAGTRV
jgi:hypothetical protein